MLKHIQTKPAELGREDVAILSPAKYDYVLVGCRHKLWHDTVGCYVSITPLASKNVGEIEDSSSVFMTIHFFWCSRFWKLINTAAYYDTQQIICTRVSTVSVLKMQSKRLSQICCLPVEKNSWNNRFQVLAQTCLNKHSNKLRKTTTSATGIVINNNLCDLLSVLIWYSTVIPSEKYFLVDNILSWKGK